MANEQVKTATEEERTEEKPPPKQPCEVAIWHVVPCIRGCLARELVGRDLTQQHVGNLLGISQAAVSQYVGEKRGQIKKKEPQTYRMIVDLAEDLVKESVEDLSERICEICREIQQDKQLLKDCGVPKEQADQLTVCQ